MIHEQSLKRAKAGTGTTVDFSDTWVNELESEVTFTQAGTVLSGTYESAVSAGGTKTIGDLQDYVDGDLADDQASSGRRGMGIDQHWR